MSETTNLKLKKHDNPETNTEKFDIENYLNGNWDKIDKNVGEVNTDILNINSKNKEQDTNIGQLQENTETSSNKIAELEKELKEAQEDFYQNSIRGQASGEYIHVEDSSNCRSIIGIGGNHEQETREGYNLLNNTLQSQTINGLKVTVNEDKSVTIVGTATDATPLIFDQSKATLPAGTYILKDCGTFIESEENHGSWDSGETKTFTADATLSSSGFYKYYGSGEVVNVTLYPILIKGSELKPYEQYGAMPSPDYISSIVAVGSNANELENTAKTQTIKDVTFTVNEDGTVVANGTASQQVTLVLTKVLSLQKGDYMISGCPRGGTTSTYRIDVWKSDWSSLGFEVGNGTKISLSESIENAIVGITITKGTTVENMVFKPKIEKGKVATPYSKYGQGCVKVTKCNKNLFPALKSQSKENKGIIFSYNAETQEFRAKGTTTDTSFYTTVTFEELKYLSKDKKYILSISNLTPKKCMVALTKINVINNGIINEGKKQTTVDNLDKYKPDGFMFYGQNLEKGTKIDFTFKAQIEEGLTATSLIQHEEQSYIMPTQTEMLENDYLDYDNEEEVHIWGKKILDGTEEINLQWDASDKHGYRIAIDNIKKTTSSADKSLIISNSYKAYIQDDLFNLKYKAYGISNRYNNSEVIIRNDDITTVTAFKAYLKSQYDAGTPVMIYYKLQTPTRLAFTDEQKAVTKELINARTYKNVTNITTDSKAILSLDYAKDLETLLNNTQALAVNNASEGV